MNDTNGMNEYGVNLLQRLKNLPHHSKNYGAERWLDDENHYPRYAEVFAMIAPSTLYEIGAFVGYSAATAAAACPSLGRIEWVDNESGHPNSNELTKENIADIDDLIETAYWKSIDEAKPSTPIDVIHIDGDHSYAAVKKDLAYAASLNPRWIIGHDYELPGSGVKQAVVEFLNGNDPITYPVTNGLFIIPSNWQEGVEVFSRLRDAVIPCGKDEESPE